MLQTILICGVSRNLTSSWISYIIFLIFLGAILVLFIYISSLASNNIFKPSITLTYLLIAVVIVRRLLLYFTDPSFFVQTTTSFKNRMPFRELNSKIEFILSIIFNNYVFRLIFFIINYLLLTLIIVVKITSVQTGPLRKT